MVPGHTKAVILTFPVTEDIRQLRVKENEKIEKIPVDPNVIWIKQTVRALDLFYLHILTNYLYKDWKRMRNNGCIAFPNECKKTH